MTRWRVIRAAIAAVEHETQETFFERARTLILFILRGFRRAPFNPSLRKHQTIAREFVRRCTVSMAESVNHCAICLVFSRFLRDHCEA